MKTGSRSLLFGVHQFIWHSFTVLMAWIKLYGWPNWKELICIFIHDWGYWGCSNIEGQEGERHPELAGRIALYLLGDEAEYLCLFHSRNYARKHDMQPSKLCWPDKLSIIYDPWWLYLPRAWLSGELKEYRQKASQTGAVPLSASNREWHQWLRSYYARLGIEGHKNMNYEGELLCV
jgi:hypothetical protein